jgi:hypothetical protein
MTNLLEAGQFPADIDVNTQIRMPPLLPDRSELDIPLAKTKSALYQQMHSCTSGISINELAYHPATY